MLEKLNQRGASAVVERLTVAEPRGRGADLVGGGTSSGEGTGRLASRHHQTFAHVFDGRTSLLGASCSAMKTLRTWRALRPRGITLVGVLRGWS